MGYNDLNKNNVLKYFSNKNTDIKYVITGINFSLEKKSLLKKNIISNSKMINKIKRKSNSKSNRKPNSKSNRKPNSKSNRKPNSKSNRKPNSKSNRKPNSKSNRKPNSKSNRKSDILDVFIFGKKKNKLENRKKHHLYSN